jgi:hypothetical protein
MARVPGAFAAFVCAIAIGSFAANVRFVDSAGLSVVLATLPLLSLALVGSFLVVRRAGGPIGWLLGAAGALLQLGTLANAYGYASLTASTALPGGELALWFGYPAAITALGLVVCALVRFPDGQPLNRVFAILLWTFVAFGAVAVVGLAFADQSLLAPRQPGELPRSIPNPFAVRGPIGDLLLLAASTISVVVALAPIAPIALVIRFLRSRGVERQQLKWLMYTAAITSVLGLGASLDLPGPIKVVAEATVTLGIGLLPITIAIAVSRYRLYDIDVLIRRTLTYAVLSAVLLVAYVSGVALIQSVFSPVTSGNGLAVAISTLAVVALFQPLRRRIQSSVDRRFYRRRYDAVQTLDSFAVKLRDEIDLTALQAELIRTVGETLQPTYASLWLRGTH